MTAEAAFQAILSGEMDKTAISPYTRAVLDMTDLSPEDEAALDRAAVTLAPAQQLAPAVAHAPEEPQEDLQVEPTERGTAEHDEVPHPPEDAPPATADPVPVETPETGSLPHAEHDEIPTEELKVTHPPEAFRENFGFMFNSDEVVPDAYRIVLALRYREDWFDWEPETLWEQVRNDFGPLGDVARGKIMALRTCLKTNTPWIDWDAFEHVCQAFNDGLVNFGEMQPPELEEAAYTVTVLRHLGDWPFGAEVSGYLSAVCLDAGLVYAPDEWFPSAQYFMDKQSRAPQKLREVVAAAWEKLKDADLGDVSWKETNPVDNQIRKLWSIRSYINEHKLQPEQQKEDQT